MSDVGGRSWTPQDILWEMGASFIDASADTAADVIGSALERVGTLLDANAGGIWHVDPATMLSENMHSWARDASSRIGAGTPVRPDPSVRDAVLEGGGMATVALHTVLGEDFVAERGWQQGVAVVALIERSAVETVVLVLGMARGELDDDAVALVRGTVLMLRQFYTRQRAEDRLRRRQQLDELTLSLATRLQSVGADDVDAEITRAFEELAVVFGAESVVLVDVINEHEVRVPMLIGPNELPPEFDTVPIPDISSLPGAEGMTLREYIAEPRVVGVADMVDALMGPEVSEALGLRNPPRTVALLPASVVNGDSLLAVARLGAGDWTDQEFDTISTLASVVAQTRGRVAAQRESSELLVAQRALSAVGKTFLEASSETAATAIHDALASIGTVLNADMSVIAAVGSDRETVTITDSWSATGELVVEAGTTLNRNAHPMIDEMMTADTELSVRDSTDDLAGPLRDADGGNWTAIVAPIKGVGLSSAAVTFIWATGEIGDEIAARDLANSTADLIGQLSVRIRAEADLRRRLEVDAVLSEVAERFLGASLDAADDVTTDVFSRLGHALDLRGIVLGGLDSRRAVVEAAWAPAGRVRPQVGHAISFDREVSAELVAQYQLRREEEGLGSEVAASLWGPDVRLRAHPVVVGGEVDSILNVATVRQLSAHEDEAMKSLAMMLGQFRARIAEERNALQHLATQRVLSECAAVLAEATPDDYDQVLAELLGRVGDYADLGGLFDWRVEERRERYVLAGSWLSEDSGPRDLPTEWAWGDAPILDDSRRSHEPSTSLLTIADGDGPSRIAIPRGSDTVDRILVAVRTDTFGFDDDTVNLLQAVSRMIHEVDVRIGAQRYAQAAFEGAPIGVVLRDVDLKLITCNQAFVDFVGAGSVDELTGTGPQFVYDDAYESIEWTEESNGQLTAEAAFRGAGGSRVWGQMRGSVIQGDSGDYFWLIHIEDITERRRAEQLLRFQASHDELTGLANRRRLLDEIHRLEHGPGSVAVLLLDLDRFKNINDSLGHDRGDELLVVIADRLRLAVRPGDLVARLGGDEFAIVLPGPVAVAEAEFVAERLMRLIGEPVVLGRQKIYPTASIGIAVADDQTGVDDLIRRADTAMYRAKSEGRARAESFDEELREAVHTRMATESGLRGALRSDELLVYYQPEVSLVDGSTLGAEALVRWNHPDQGVLPAGAFIEVAEETGLVVEIGEFVLAQACREAASWGGDDGPMIRVNLAAAQLQREDTVTLVRSVLAETSLNPARLCLEITESAVMTDVNRSEEILHRLKALGVHLAVDDFGTGFSSLAYLKRFPVDALKIDRAFVNDLARDSEDEAFVKSIVSLAAALSLDVVAEGVETREQAALLLDLGCRRAQGFYFAKPAPAEELRGRLDSVT